MHVSLEERIGINIMYFLQMKDTLFWYFKYKYYNFKEDHHL